MNWSYKIVSYGELAIDGTCVFSCEVFSDTDISNTFTLAAKPSEAEPQIKRKALELAEKYELSLVLPIEEELILGDVPGYTAFIHSADFNWETSGVDVKYSLYKDGEKLITSSFSVADVGMAQMEISNIAKEYNAELERLSAIATNTPVSLT